VTLVAGVTLYSFEACVENNVTVIDVICSAVILSLVSTAAAAGELFLDFQPLADAAIGIDNSANTRSVTAARDSFMGVNDAAILKVLCDDSQARCETLPYADDISKIE
jgi:hypothetical protein